MLVQYQQQQAAAPGGMHHMRIVASCALLGTHKHTKPGRFGGRRYYSPRVYRVLWGRLRPTIKYRVGHPPSSSLSSSYSQYMCIIYNGPFVGSAKQQNGLLLFIPNDQKKEASKREKSLTTTICGSRQRNHMVFRCAEISLTVQRYTHTRYVDYVEPTQICFKNYSPIVLKKCIYIYTHKKCKRSICISRIP